LKDLAATHIQKKEWQIWIWDVLNVSTWMRNENDVRIVFEWNLMRYEACLKYRYTPISLISEVSPTYNCYMSLISNQQRFLFEWDGHEAAETKHIN
jgi:hypothetical protein